MIRSLFSPANVRQYAISTALGVVSVSVHPGNLVASSLHRHCLAHRLAAQLLRPWTKSPAMAAASVVLGLTSEEVNIMILSSRN